MVNMRGRFFHPPSLAGRPCKVIEDDGEYEFMISEPLCFRQYGVEALPGYRRSFDPGISSTAHRMAMFDDVHHKEYEIPENPVIIKMGVGPSNHR